MPKQYVGHLSSHDPLHPYLVNDVLPKMGVPRNGGADFRVFSMKDSKVYLYEDSHSRAQVVGSYPSGRYLRPPCSQCDSA